MPNKQSSFENPDVQVKVHGNFSKDKARTAILSIYYTHCFTLYLHYNDSQCPLVFIIAS